MGVGSEVILPFTLLQIHLDLKLSLFSPPLPLALPAVSPSSTPLTHLAFEIVPHVHPGPWQETQIWVFQGIRGRENPSIAAFIPKAAIKARRAVSKGCDFTCERDRYRSTVSKKGSASRWQTCAGKSDARLRCNLISGSGFQMSAGEQLSFFIRGVSIYAVFPFKMSVNLHETSIWPTGSI